jgi:hypothetical protein
VEEEVVVEDEGDGQVGFKNIVIRLVDSKTPLKKKVEGGGSPEQRPRKPQSGLGALRV